MFGSKISSVAKLFGLFTFILTLLLLSTTSFATDPYVIDLIAGQHTKVGTVTVAVVSGSLQVTYKTDPPWLMSATQLSVKPSWELIPQSNGNPVPGKFQYKANHNPAANSNTYTITPAPTYSPIYIAAHADVFHDYTSSYGITTDMHVTAVGGKYIGSSIPYLDSYLLFNATIPGLPVSDSYKGYCLDPIRPILGLVQGNLVYYQSNVYSSYGMPSGSINNLDEINYILNNFIDNSNYCPIGNYKFGDIQAVIWYFASWYLDDPSILFGVGGTKVSFLNGKFGIGNWDSTRVSTIIAETISEVTLLGGYIPPSNGVMALILANPFSQYLFGISKPFANGQPCLIIIPVPSGGSETAWAGTLDGQLPFPGSNWAMYFKYPPDNTGSSKKK